MKKSKLALMIGAFLSTQVAAMDDNFSSSSSLDLSEDWEASYTQFDFESSQRKLDLWQAEDTPAWKKITMKGNLNHMLATPRLEVGQKSVLATEFISDGGFIRFDLFVRGKYGNTLHFYINDELMRVDEQTTKQYQLHFPLPPAGQPVKLKWVYQKNLTSFDLIDRARIDNLKISGNMDSDQDGFNDAWEFKYFDGLEQINVDSATHDFDGDSLSNRQEYFNNTNPNKIDSDDDGWNDAKEIIMGTPPLISNQEAITDYQQQEAELSFHLALSMLEQGLEEGMSMLQGLAEQRLFTPAMHKLGLMYLYGIHTPKDVHNGLYWLRQAAASGEAAAQVQLYYAIDGLEAAGPEAFGDIEVQSMREESIDLLHRAAELGDAEAYYLLAEAYRLGHWIQVDHVQAHFWYQKVVETDAIPYMADSLQRLGELYQAGSGVEQDLVQASAYFVKAFEAGYQAPSLDEQD
jgi:TPR repeat protein